MAGYRGPRFAAALAVALALSGNAFAQQFGAPPAPPNTFPTLPELPPLPPEPQFVQPPTLPQVFPANPQMIQSLPAAQRFNFKIEPNAPVKELLPVAPKASPVRGPLLTDDLAKVPEAEFEARPETLPANGKLTEQAAHQLAKINHLNAKKTDAFMAALLENRPDLAGLPFAMGDDCRTSAERSKLFAQAVATVRQALPGNGGILPVVNSTQFNAPNPGGQPVPGNALRVGRTTPQNFWLLFANLCDNEDAARSKSDKALAEHVTLARIGALMQMLAPEPVEMRAGLVKYLTAIPHVEATRALAKLAIFTAEDEVRNAAVDALKVRREKDYTDILVMGLRYPFPAVAKRAADAVARMGRTDLIGELVTVLDEEDPRLPRTKDSGWTRTTVVREMVKVNHHRNCMMCHAPGTTGVVVQAGGVTAEVPVQDQALPSPAQGYRQSSPDLLIRIDVTYLRQDFSVMLAVAEAHPWPEMQRFDFMVRERIVTTEEAAVYREKLTPKEAGVLSPYHKAALAALRELTGKDTTPTAAAWRKLLDMQLTRY